MQNSEDAAMAPPRGGIKVSAQAQPAVGKAASSVPLSETMTSGGIKVGDDDRAVGNTATGAAAALGVAGLTALTALAAKSGHQVPMVLATKVAGVADPSKAGEAGAAKPVAVGAKRPAAEGAKANGEENDPKKKEKKLYPCEICGVVLKSFGGHTGHMLGHAGEKPYSCMVCQKAFRHVNALRNHERIHTGIKPFKCNQCDKCFVEQGQLKNHQMIHSDMKPHICPEEGCDFKTRTAGNLREHQRTHSEERKLACTECNKTFKQHSVLRTHMLTHTGERPYKCDECGQGFIKSYNIKKHKEVHHIKDKPPKQTVKRRRTEDGSNDMVTGTSSAKKSKGKAPKESLTAAAVVSAPASAPVLGLTLLSESATALVKSPETDAANILASSAKPLVSLC